MQAKTKNNKTIALLALFLAASVVISFVETVSGINSLLPFPGVRLGLCNIAITACFYSVSYTGTLAISLVRPLFLFVFSSNPVSFAMSLCGSVFAYISLVITRKCYKKVFSFCGISCISAVFHSLGQTAAAMIIMGDDALLLYLPMFCALSAVIGTLLGAVMNSLIPRLCVVMGRGKCL